MQKLYKKKSEHQPEIRLHTDIDTDLAASKVIKMPKIAHIAENRSESDNTSLHRPNLAQGSQKNKKRDMSGFYKVSHSKDSSVDETLKGQHEDLESPISLKKSEFNKTLTSQIGGVGQDRDRNVSTMNNSPNKPSAMAGHSQISMSNNYQIMPI